jgi:uncharacterized damage-inducible protein DinB
MSRSYSLAADNLAVLEQGVALLEQIDDQLYTRVDEQIFRTCVGTHMRHLLDFYASFERGLPDGRIDYDARQRDTSVERDRGAALDRLRGIAARLEALGDAEAGRPLLARQDSSAPAEDPEAWGASTLRRELQALVSHTIHHYALIAVLLRRHGFEPAPDFGVAPSTLLHWKAGR